MKKFLNLFRTNLFLAMGIIICAAWIITAVFANQVTPQDPLAQDISIRLQAPGADHWFGTDSLGRDVFSRVIAGAKISIFAGLITVVSAAVIGSLYGGIAGYAGGIIDDIMMIATGSKIQGIAGNIGGIDIACNAS